MSGADRVIRISTAAVVLGVAAIAAYVSYRHAVRHEALHNREGVEGLFLRVVAAAW